MTFRSDENTDIELTILMPCLNEAETLAICIDKAFNFLNRTGIQGEILIADNGSTDGSLQIATTHGARIISEPQRGYGSALLKGIEAAHGHFIIMGDADDSYDFSNLDLFVQELRNGAELVIGNRFLGCIEQGAMPLSHRYLGNPVLSFIGKVLFGSPCGDFHCGLRGFKTSAIKRLSLNTTGMEFASEMIVRAALENLNIREVPTTLSVDGRTRPPHLKTWTDGWRHLRFLLMYSPQWLFLIPGLFFTTIGLIVVILLIGGPLEIGAVRLDNNTFVVGCILTMGGLQSVLLFTVIRKFSAERGFLPLDNKSMKFFRLISLEKIIVIASVLIIASLCAMVYVYLYWQRHNFGDITSIFHIRLFLFSSFLLTFSLQLIPIGFIGSILEIPSKKQQP